MKQPRHSCTFKTGTYPRRIVNKPTTAFIIGLLDSRRPIIMSSDTNKPKYQNPQLTVSRMAGSNTTNITTLDGSYGEGGGQLIRNACSYASILHQNLHLTNIRLDRRPKPGLRPQHVAGLQLLADACGGQVVAPTVGSRYGDPTMMTHNAANIIVGSSEVFFLGATNKEQAPKSHNHDKSGFQEIVGDTKTAGSICLLLQAVLPYTLFSHQGYYKLILKGGTNATMAPPIDYFQHVFVPTLLEFCGERWVSSHGSIQTDVTTRGFYPKGGGHVEVMVQSPTIIDDNDHKKPWKMSPIRRTERGDVTEIVIHAFAAGTCHSSMAHTLAATAKMHLQEYLTDTLSKATISTEVLYHRNSIGGGCGILLVAKTSTGCILGASGIGSRNVPLPHTARQASIELIDILQSGACVDDYLQDQLILYMALADGISEMITNGVTLHTQTAIWVAEQLCEGVRFEVMTLPNEVKDGGNQALRQPDIPRGDNHREGKVPGLHLIRCYGIGFTPSDTWKIGL
jgi:RNA 3'-terminal phosphate cyclase (ATP)